MTRLNTQIHRIVVVDGKDYVVSIVAETPETHATDRGGDDAPKTAAEIRIRKQYANKLSTATFPLSGMVESLNPPAPSPDPPDGFVDVDDVCSSIMIDPRIAPATRSTISTIVREIADDPDCVRRRERGRQNDERMHFLSEI